MPAQIFPQVDMLQVIKASRQHRNHILKYLPKCVELTCVDYKDDQETDFFYLDTQDYREYYRDPLNMVHRPAAFRQYHGECGIKHDYDFVDLLKPPQFVTEPQPVVYQLKHTGKMNLDGRIRIGAHFTSNTSTVFKR